MPASGSSHLYGALAPNTSRVISIKDAHDSGGGVAIVDVVPFGASAVAFNVTVTGPTGPNFLSITPGDAATYVASTINFPAGDDRAVGGGGQLGSPPQVKVFCGNQGGRTHGIT